MPRMISFGLSSLPVLLAGQCSRAAAALYAGVGLQADELREIGSGYEAEIFVADQRWNLAEAATG